MSTKGSHHMSLTLLAALSILSLYTTFLLYCRVQRIKSVRLSRWQEKIDLDTFTYVGDDFPEYLPIHLGDIKVEGGKEWPAISMPFDEFDSSYRLGPQNRTFSIIMFHELHCLEYIKVAVDKDENPPVDMGHVHHCFNLLRQCTLCVPDLTVEPGDFVERGPSRNLVSSNRTCHNWDVLYQAIVQNFRNWDDFTVMQGWKFTWQAKCKSDHHHVSKT